jgi:biotin carboxyl carrier protein
MSTQRAAQPGAVVQHIVHIGDIVLPGDPVMIVETMKFEAAIVATEPGTVRAIAPLGTIVQVGAELLTVDPDADRRRDDHT